MFDPASTFLAARLVGLLLTLFMMGLFGAALGWGRPLPLPKICHAYPAMMKLSTIISYLKQIQKIYESRDTPLKWLLQAFLK